MNRLTEPDWNRKAQRQNSLQEVDMKAKMPVGGGKALQN